METTIRPEAEPLRDAVGAALALDGVPETLLWTLHNRAQEAMRPDALLRDPDAVRLYRSIDYDYARSFGTPDGSHALRSHMFDEALRPWLAAHPGGTVVELACGLETQFQRCDDGAVRWLCVEVPETIAVRERFLPASERCRHLAKSALDLSWLDEVDASRGVFITAQGLLMYFEEAQVHALLAAIDARLPGAQLMFDTIPRWFSRKTVAGFYKTPQYRAPPMPWGISHRRIVPTLHRWMPHAEHIEIVPYGFYRGVAGRLLPLFSRLPGLRNLLPSIVRVRLKGQA